MELSVVILSWNSLPQLRPCLESLRPVLERPGVELIWVDNGSADGASGYVTRAFPRSRRIVLPENRGVAAGRNCGLREAKGEYVLILDDDTESTPQAIDALAEHLRANPLCGVAACALRDSGGRLQDSFKPYPGVGVKIRNVLRSKTGLKAKETTLPEGVTHPCYVIGACQMIRASVLRQVGLLDEHIFYGPEDADFCLRVAAAGYTVDYLPHISILHHWRRITSRSLTSASSRRHIRALLYFWRKHHRWL